MPIIDTDGSVMTRPEHSLSIAVDREELPMPDLTEIATEIRDHLATIASELQPNDDGSKPSWDDSPDGPSSINDYLCILAGAADNLVPIAERIATALEAIAARDMKE